MRKGGRGEDDAFIGYLTIIFPPENHVCGMISIIDAWLKDNYEDERLKPCWCSVVYAVADRVGGNNPAAARNIAKKWKGMCSYKICMRTDSAVWIFMQTMKIIHSTIVNWQRVLITLNSVSEWRGT